MTVFDLFIHIFTDKVHRNMTRTLDNNLYIVFPCDFRQLSKHLQFTELGFIVRVGNASRAQSISQ